VCLTGLDPDLEIPDAQAPRPDPRQIGGQYAGVAWGLAERLDGPDTVEVALADPK
jgi:hypothetical protein